MNLIEILRKISVLADSISKWKDGIPQLVKVKIEEEIIYCLHQVHSFFIDAKSTIAQPKSTHFLPLNKILILTFSFSDPRETRTIAQGSKFFAATS